VTLFTPEDDAAILRGGWDDRTLADMLFMSVTTLRARRDELTRPPYEIGTSRPSGPRHSYIFWSPSQDRTLQRLAMDGLSYRQIANQMGRTWQSTSCRAQRLTGVRR
jgi:hypothetical protein